MPDINNDFREIEPDFPVVQTLLREGLLGDALTSSTQQNLHVQLKRSATGEIQSADIDVGNDKTIDRKMYFGRDPLSRAVNRVDIDSNADGKLDDIITFRRSTLNPQQLQSASIDRGRNGTTDEMWNFYHGAQGAGPLSGIKYDFLGANRHSDRATFHRSLGPGMQGVLNSITMDNGQDGKVDSTLKVNRNHEGLYSMNVDRNADGKYDAHLKVNRNHLRDVNGMSIDRNGDGTYESTMRLKRDIHKRTTSIDIL